tara:strand:- start:124 stop:1068 length:945 start_codon:yes stop_codon:yes gene_type:complete
MKKNKILVLREGINSTFQDLGRNNFYHIGLPFSGAMDKRNYLIANKLVGNKQNEAVIEFAYQGPLIKIDDGNINFAISGDIKFNIKKNGNLITGDCYKNYNLSKGDEVDIISTNNSVYGYFAVSGGFDLKNNFGSFSTHVRSNVGANNGNKIQKDEKFFLKDFKVKVANKSLKYMNSKIEYIRILKGTNFDYFIEQSKKEFTSKEFLVSKLSDRMGMRLEGPKIKNFKETNIRSEGLIKGVIQVPADGNPIIMLSDHGTIGGYPKIGVVISADYDRLVQTPPGKKIKFELIELKEAEKLYKLYQMETENLLSQI